LGYFCGEIQGFENSKIQSRIAALSGLKHRIAALSGLKDSNPESLRSRDRRDLKRQGKRAKVKVKSKKAKVKRAK
jgi:hypothetical protein